MLQQVFTLIQTILSKWLDDSEVVQVGRLYRLLQHACDFLCVCMIYPRVSTDSRPALLSPPCRQCVGYLISRFGPSYMISGPWWLSWAGCWGRSTSPSHRHPLWTWHGRYAPSDPGLRKNMCWRRLTCLWGQMSLSRSLFGLRWFTYLLGRSSTSPTSKAWLRCWPLPRSVYFSKVTNACKERTFNLLLEKVLSCLILYLFHRSTWSSWYCRIVYAPSCSGRLNILLR